MRKKTRRKKRQRSAVTKYNAQLSQQERAYIEKIVKQVGDDNIQLVEYTITDEPIENPWFNQLPKKVQERIDALYDLTLSDPKAVIAEVSAFIRKYPKVPLFYNYLSVAHAQLGDFERRDVAIKACYKRFPNYLFGRVNYAQLCLEDGDADKIPEIFDEKLNLGQLYPQRTTFHVSEYAGFAGIMGLYYLHLGEREAAKMHYKTLKQIAPEHHATRKLWQALRIPLRVRVARWIYQKFTGR